MFHAQPPYRTGQFICSKTGQLYLLTTCNSADVSNVSFSFKTRLGNSSVFMRGMKVLYMLAFMVLI